MKAFPPDGDIPPGPERPAFAPFGRLSRSALAENVRAVVADGSGGTVVDVTRSAWGHNPFVVAPDALRAGAHGVRIDQVRPRSLGITDDDVRWGEEGVVDPLRVYGLPGADGELRGRPVMSFHGRVVLVKRLLAGEGVSYGYTHRAERDTRIALVTGGYAQGVVRGIGNHAAVSVGGRSCRVLGRVAMDVTMIDIGDADVAPGAEVCFFGDPASGAPSLGAWVTATGLTAAEIVATISRRSRMEVTA